MPRNKKQMTDEEFELEKARLKEEFQENLALIREIIPNYVFPESRIDRYITKERMELHRRVLDYNESVAEHRLAYDATMIPESYERSMYTFYDKSGTEEAKARNRRMLDLIQSPTAEGDQLRIRFFLDSLNTYQNLDPSGLSNDKTFEEKAAFLLENMDICERGFEFQKINYAKTSSLGIRFSAEHEENIKTIERKAVDIGGRSRTIKSIIQSDLFLTFPFEDLTMDQTVMLVGSMQSLVQSKGVSNKESQKYGALLTSLIYASKEPDGDQPFPHTYTMDDVTDIRYDVPEVKEQFSALYRRLMNAGTEEERRTHEDAGRLLDALKASMEQLSEVNGAFTPEQGACFYKTSADLYLAAFRSMGKEPDGDADSFDAQLYGIQKDICAFMTPNLINKLLFERVVCGHNVLHGGKETPEYLAALNNMVNKVRDCGLSYEKIRETAKDLYMSPEEFVKQASEETIKWQPEEREIQKIRAAHEQKEKANRAKEVMQKYSIPKEFERLISSSEITAEEIDELPFIKEAASQEEKNKALAAYLRDGRKYVGGTLPEEYAQALAEENLSYSDVWSLALRQGITVDTYFNRMLGKEDISIDPDHKPESIEQQYERNLNEINGQLRASAKNPIETLMVETMLEMKELSFTPGNRADMEKCAARFVALKAIQNYAGLKKGESLEDDPNRAAALSKVLVNLDKFTKDVYERDSFRYFVKTNTTAELAALSRGGTTDGLYRFCDAVKELEQGKLLHTDYITCTDKVLTYSDYAMRNENFFPDKFSLSGTLIKDYPNPFRISVARTGLLTLAYGRMLEKGFDMEDILDPYKLTEVKKQIGAEVFEMVQHEENREAVEKTYLVGYEKTLAYTNKLTAKLNSLNPIDVVKLDEPAFLALGHLLKDYSQELGRMKKDVPLSAENEQKLTALDNEGESIDKYLQTASRAMEKLVAMKTEKSFANQASSYNQDFLNLAYMNRSFVRTKELAGKRGMTMSAYIYAESTEKPQDPSTAIGMIEQGAVLSMNYAYTMPQPLKNEFETKTAVRNQISRDVFSGEFSRNLKITAEKNGRHAISTDYYDQFVRNINKAPKRPAL